MFTLENFIQGIQTATNIVIESQGNKLVLNRTFHDIERSNTETYKIGELYKEEIESIILDLNNNYLCNETMLLNNKFFEVAVQAHDRMRIPPIRSDRNLYAFSEHNYEFCISKASPIYTFALICNCEVDFGSIRPYRQENITNIEDFSELFRILTVKITSDKGHSISGFRRMLHSYLFNIAYNYNITFSITDFSESRHPFRRRARREGQLFPYKSYKQELTKYYHQAVATDIPFTQYLAFYHVAEYFFQTISEQDALYDIESFITRPSFSPYKKEDMKRFYEMIKKKMREQRDDGVWNEKTGLLLCLKKHVTDLDSLKNSIETIDISALEHYKDNLVEFADDSRTINFDENADKLYVDIRDRVYSVRNAIVHSKEGDRLRYEPFKHDKQLAKEIPLIRSIAEEIIINSAKPIEFNFDE